MDVAQSPLAALGRHQVRVEMIEVAKRRAGVSVTNDGAGGDVDDQVLAVLAEALRAAALPAALGFVDELAGQVAEVLHRRRRMEDNAAAPPAVAAVRAASRHVLFAAKRHRAVAALSGLDPQANPVQERHPSILKKKKGARESPPVLKPGWSQLALGVMLTLRLSKETCPSTSAKMV